MVIHEADEYYSPSISSDSEVHRRDSKNKRVTGVYTKRVTVRSEKYQNSKKRNHLIHYTESSSETRQPERDWELSKGSLLY